MAVPYRENIGIFFLINALLIPLILMNENFLISGLFMLLFIISQTMMTILFIRTQDQGFFEWYTIWTVIIGTAFMFAVLMHGRSKGYDTLGVFLFAVYLISAIIYFIPWKKSVDSNSNSKGHQPVESQLSDEEMKQFREKDELAYLLDSFEIPKVKRQSHLTDYDDFKEPKKTFALDDSYKKEKIFKTSDSSQEASLDDYYEITAPESSDAIYTPDSAYIEFYPQKKLQQQASSRQIKDAAPIKKKSGHKVQIVELNEAPKIDAAHIVKTQMTKEQITASINEKMNLLSEKAILEGAQRRLSRMVSDAKSKHEAGLGANERISLMAEKSTLEDAQKKLARMISEQKENKESRPSIDEKIKLIAEKAILEGAQKKITKMAAEAKAKREESQHVYASITGDKFHKRLNCMSLKRVRRKDIILYENSKDANKKGLRACGLCNN